MNQLQRLGLGDRVTGQIHICNGISDYCNKEHCRKFAGFVINIVKEGAVLRGTIGKNRETIENPIPKRWILEVKPDKIESSQYAVNALANFARPRESRE